MTMLRMRVHQIQEPVQFRPGKKPGIHLGRLSRYYLYTAEIHVSRKCTLKDHFFETFLILCRIKNKTYISQQLTTLYKPRWYFSPPCIK
jgi:hypothetical protein